MSKIGASGSVTIVVSSLWRRGMLWLALLRNEHMLITLLRGGGMVSLLGRRRVPNAPPGIRRIPLVTLSVMPLLGDREVIGVSELVNLMCLLLSSSLRTLHGA